EGTYTIYMRARNTDDKLYEAQIALRDNYEIAENNLTAKGKTITADKDVNNNLIIKVQSSK
ncbi:hypothetical protein, partial [Clostridium sp.]|uniref:hypothetical protein n=1 Tax=Clostridium sp. TaxID=1506 RepID=UPI00291083FE